MLVRCSECNAVFPDFLTACPECKAKFQKSENQQNEETLSTKERRQAQKEYEELVLDFVYRNL